jgi:selT/selW/selH-like putative selenoprotein
MIRRTYGIQPTLVRGTGGIFDVVIDGETVFSKWQTNRFPTNQEILNLIAARQKAG